MRFWCVIEQKEQLYTLQCNREEGSAIICPTAKLPILKLGEYEMWAIRIKQYFQIQDYALWEVIENGDSWVSVSQTSQENGITVTKMSTPATAKEKTNKKNDVKARVCLRMNKLSCRLNSIRCILYNNFKIVEQKVKKTVGTSSGGENLAFMTAPSSSSTNDANTVCSQVSAASPGVNTASPQVSLAKYVEQNFMKDDLEAIDLKWPPPVRRVRRLSLAKCERAKKYYQKDKERRKCRAPSSKEGQFKKSRPHQEARKQLRNTFKEQCWANDVNRPNKLDLFYSGLDEFKEPEFKGYGPEKNDEEQDDLSQVTSNVDRVKGVNVVKSVSILVWRPTKC
ncbi:hypothetical protein Tco_0386056 [Tanacetum coccineum]